MASVLIQGCLGEPSPNISYNFFIVFINQQKVNEDLLDFIKESPTIVNTGQGQKKKEKKGLTSIGGNFSTF